MESVVPSTFRSLTILSLLSLAAGAQNKSAVPFPVVKDLTTVSVDYRNGPISVHVSGTGAVEYNGTAGVVVEGKHQTHIKPEEVKEIVDAFRRADFFSLSDDYASAAANGKSTTTSIQIGSLKKAVSAGWLQAPPGLEAVQDAILRCSHSDQWVVGDANTVKSLLAETPNAARRQELLSDTLPRAAAYADTELVKEILGHKVDVERRAIFGATALMHAAERGLPEMVSALLAAHADVHARDAEGRTALIFGALSGNAVVVELLLDAGAKANESDKYGDTALMAAAAAGDPNCVDLLLKRGAEVNAKNTRGQTALLSGATAENGFAAADKDRIHSQVPDDLIHRDEVVRLLLDAGADVNARGGAGKSALFSSDDEIIEEILRHDPDLEVRDDTGATALIESASESIVELLLEAGANVNAEDKDGKTALIQAAEQNYIEKLQILVQAPDIQLDHRDRAGETALAAAKRTGHKECLQVLIEADAQ
jgi:ankyrin repeat protein